MKVVKKVELSQNDLTFIEELKELLERIRTGTAIECEEINCKNCPFNIGFNKIYRCAITRLHSEIQNFIELTEDI